MNFLRNTVEKSVFGVCSKAADQLGIKTTRVRLYFIYITFITMGSPLIIYIFVAFWMNIKKYMRRGKNWILD